MSSLSKVERLLPELRAYARSICDGNDDAEDLVQDAVERACRSNDRPARLEQLRPWMFKVIRNLKIDELRKRRVRLEYSEREKRQSGEGLTSDPSRDVLIRLAFEKLPPATREILFLVDVMGMTYVEAAGVLDVPAGTVMSRVSRARRALHALVEGRTDGAEEDRKSGRK